MTQSGNNEDEDRRTLYSTAQRFKTKSECFSVKLYGDVHDHFRNYGKALNDDKLSTE